jgi:DNA polymerase
LIVGEAPGKEEDADGVSFIGKSGQLLMNMLELAWPDYDEEIREVRSISAGDKAYYYEKLRTKLDKHVFWTNAVCCKTEDKRAPSNDELKACRSRLHDTIYAVDPLLIIGAGKVAATALLGKKVSILQKRGTIFDIDIVSPTTGRKIRYPMMALLHPSYLLRKGDKALVTRKTGDTYETLEDLRYALHLVEAHYRISTGGSLTEKS